MLLFREELASGMVLSIPPPFLTCLRERVGPLGPRFSCDDGIPAIVNAPHLQIYNERERWGEEEGKERRGGRGKGVREGERNVERSVRDGLVKFDEANGNYTALLSPKQRGKV